MPTAAPTSPQAAPTTSGGRAVRGPRGQKRTAAAESQQRSGAVILPPPAQPLCCSDLLSGVWRGRVPRPVSQSQRVLQGEVRPALGRGRQGSDSSGVARKRKKQGVLCVSCPQLLP